MLKEMQPTVCCVYQQGRHSEYAARAGNGSCRCASLVSVVLNLHAFLLARDLAVRVVSLALCAACIT